MKIQWKNFYIYQLFIFLVTKSQAGNTLIRELLCVSSYKFAAKTYLNLEVKYLYFTKQKGKKNKLKSAYRNSLHILEAKVAATELFLTRKKGLQVFMLLDLSMLS